MSHDIVANMLTAIRNASLQKAKVVEIRATSITRSIAKLLLQEKWITNLRERQYQSQFVLVLVLKYQGKNCKSCITTFTQISKPGLRIYAKSQEIPKILGGIGMVILSTSKGIMTDRQARNQNLGGELLCSIW
jgi:small subunit ribosomal protein S8